jgi:hypothetical protein
MRISAFILIVLVWTACNKNENNCIPPSDTFTCLSNKSIDTSAHYINVVNGNNTVFEFRHNFEKCPAVVGAADNKTLYFEIPSNQTSFNYSSADDFSLIKAITYLNAPIDPALRKSYVNSGSIQGTKTGATVWHVKVSATCASGETISFESDFNVQ